MIAFDNGMPRFTQRLAAAPAGPPSVDDLLGQVAAAHRDTVEAERAGLFVTLPKQAPRSSKDASRIKTVRNRLHLLGYMDRDNGRGGLDEALAEALRRFQAEARLSVDGWVGEEETWPALQELVGFEAPIHLEKWFRGGVAVPALRRAAALRLHALGFLPHRPNGPPDNLDHGLQAFGRVWRALFDDGPSSRPAVCVEWLALLFDLDGITRRLARVSKKPEGVSRERCHAFIINAAKIELWLMGYRVKPGGYDLAAAPPVPTPGAAGLTSLDVWLKSNTLTQFNRVKRNLLFYKALHRFWIDNGFDDGRADKKSVCFLKDYKSFFSIVDEGLRTDRALPAEQRRIDLETFIAPKRAEIPLIWHHVRRIGARMWDGLRRVWGWFRRMVTRFGRRVLTIGLNLSRIVYDFALGAFTVIRDLFRSMHAMARWVATPVPPGSNRRPVLLRRDADHDMVVVVAGDAGPAEVQSYCYRLDVTSRRVGFGFRVVGVFVALLKEAFLSGWGAYFGLVRTLVRIRRWQGTLADLIEAYQRLFHPATGCAWPA